MASAIWVPNVEFIFGLTGATASVIISYILPAVTFIKLLEENPDLTRPLGTTSSLKSNAQDTRYRILQKLDNVESFAIHTSEIQNVPL